MADFNQVSKNFSVAKGVGALVVMIGHYSLIPNFWIVVTIGMLIFSITSGYFTYIKYNGEFSWLKYWRKKAIRLVPHMLIIYIFLTILFLVQQREGIWSIYTLINILGMNGILNWFYIKNPSPFGAGMWFLTLIILFYILYPLIERLYRNNIISIIVTVAMLILFYYMSTKLKYGHALWMTASGFPVGIFIGKHNISVSKLISLITIAILSLIMLFAHYIILYDNINHFLIISISIFVLLLVKELDLPNYMVIVGLWLSSMLLEVYLLHPYLEITSSPVNFINVCISICIAISVGTVLVWFVDKLSFGMNYIPKKN